jgi:hypothetical protein
VRVDVCGHLLQDGLCFCDAVTKRLHETVMARTPLSNPAPQSGHDVRSACCGELRGDDAYDHLQSVGNSNADLGAGNRWLTIGAAPFWTRSGLRGAP